MAKNAKLKDALAREKGVDPKLERQKRLQKKAAKRKRSRKDDDDDGDSASAPTDAAEEDQEQNSNAAKRMKVSRESGTSPAELVDGEAESSDNSDGWETAEEDLMHSALDLRRLQDSDTSDSEEDEEGDGDGDVKMVNGNGVKSNGHASIESEDEDDNEDIPLSDIESLASEDKGDVIPHQRLTINNVGALTRAYKSIVLPESLPFSATQAVTLDQATEIADIEDDLKREAAFSKQSLEAVKRARALLKAEGVPFSRPADYFAEMVKTDEHMGKIKKKLVDDAAGKKAAAEARRQRDLKKFGKQVQVAKLQERDKEKRDTLDKIKMLKKKRSGASISNEKEDDIFDVALEDAAETQRKDRDARRSDGPGKPNPKRQSKNDKYGYGGKKRFAKSNDAASSGDTRGFSMKKMKGKTKQRPGKSRRAKTN